MLQTGETGETSWVSQFQIADTTKASSNFWLSNCLVTAPRHTLPESLPYAMCATPRCQYASKKLGPYHRRHSDPMALLLGTEATGRPRAESDRALQILPLGTSGATGSCSRGLLYKVRRLHGKAPGRKEGLALTGCLDTLPVVMPRTLPRTLTALAKLPQDL